jgi:CRISPR-associated endonuclease/helicase Cas3
VDDVNMAVLDSNLRHYEKANQPAFCKPGFETAHYPFQLKSHFLHDLLAQQPSDTYLWAIDAQPRIAVAHATLYPSRRLVDLEHARIHACMLPKPHGDAAASHAASLHWHEPRPEAPRALWLTGLLPQFQRFRYDPQRRDDVALLPDDHEESLWLHRVEDGKGRHDKAYIPVHQTLCHSIPLAQRVAATVSPWPQLDLMQELTTLALAQGLSLARCAERYATASLPACRDGWLWDERLGFTKRA